MGQFVFYEARCIDDAIEIGLLLRDGNSVMVSLMNADQVIAKRIKDLILGMSIIQEYKIHTICERIIFVVDQATDFRFITPDERI
ncbi:MAG: cell division protein SepF [bacterium]|nr:cell division protein SepF [bacterium]